MKTKLATVAGLLLGATVSLLLFGGMGPKKEKAPVLLTESDISWGLGPDAFPLGARAAILTGDPDSDGTYVLRVKLPAKYRIPPHWNSAALSVTVLSGEVALGLGDGYESESLRSYAAGSYLEFPKRARLYLETHAKPAVLEIRGEGAWETVYVKPTDDPRAVGGTMGTGTSVAKAGLKKATQ